MESLLSRIAAGEQTAVAECFDRYGALVWSLARRFSADAGDAEDAVQEVFIELWNSAHRFDPQRAAEATFVAMIARRRLIDRLRKRGRQPRTEPLEAEAGYTIEPRTEARAETLADAGKAAEMIALLKPEQQQVLKLSVFQGLSHSAIAEQTGLPLGTVKTHLRRGLIKLRDHLTSAETSRSGGTQ